MSAGEGIDSKAVDEATPGSESYKAPPEKSLKEIIEADQEDESLRKYKEALLGSASKSLVIVDENDPRKVIVRKLALLVDGREEMTLDLSGRSLFDTFLTPGTMV